MNQDRTKRKLTAILSADVVGYSRLMEEDQAWTIKNLEENKTLISNLIEEYKGRVVDAPGDNILAEFSSVTNAVECAVKIQEEIKKKNANIVENRRMEYRIGINLGEVVEEDGRIYGSGVNIAARIEGLSKSGGICISGRTYDHIKTIFDFGYEYLGEHNVKNISEPIRVYRVLMGPEAVGKVIGEKKAPSRTSRGIAMAAIIILIIIAAGLLFWNIYSTDPSRIEETPIESKQVSLTPEVKEAPKTIAVLPFDNLSPEKDQEYFVLGLSEEILNNLCQIPGLGVTGKTSSFSFKDTKKTIQEIATVLGVDNVLEGSVRKSGNALRITAQLVSAVDGLHLWSKTYDRELKDIFEVQEDIATRVADELKVTLGVGKSLKQLGGTNNLEAYELYLVAKGQAYNAEYSRALESIDAAIALDPEFALAWAGKGMTHVLLAALGSTDRVSLEIDSALESALRSIELEPSLGIAHLSLGAVHMTRDEFIEAELAYRKGMELTTESMDYFDYGLTLHYSVVGYLRKCHELLEEMRRNDPLQAGIRAWYIYSRGLLGDIQGAEEEYERGKAIFGDQWILGNLNIDMARLSAIDVLSFDEIPEVPIADPIYAIARGHIESPEAGLTELRRLYYSSDDNLNIYSFSLIAWWAAYFGDREFAMNAMERSVSLQASGLYYIWNPVMREVRQLARFKELVREIGLVDYWNRFGWPDLCRPVGDDDFECD
jgi:adenylate cyclase